MQYAGKAFPLRVVLLHDVWQVGSPSVGHALPAQREHKNAIESTIL